MNYYMRFISMVALVAFALPVFAQQMEPPNPEEPVSGREGRHHPSRKMDDGGFLGKAIQDPEFAQNVGLDESQTAVLENAFAEFKSAHAELMDKLEQAGMRQAHLLTSKELDEAALMEAVEETGRLRTEMAKLRMKKLLLMRKTLTPEQARKVREYVREQMHGKKRKAEMTKGRGRRRDRGDDPDSRFERRPPPPPDDEYDL